MTVVKFRPLLQSGTRIACSDETIIHDAGTAANLPRALEHVWEPLEAPGDGGGCLVVMAYDRVCQANDRWGEHVPGDAEDGLSVTELERAYDIFYVTRATSVAGLRLQFESLVAVADMEGDEIVHPRVLRLLENMRAGFNGIIKKG